MKSVIAAGLGVSALAGASAVLPAQQVEMTASEEQRCFAGDGLPDHATGTFPNRGNPNAITPQNVQMCVPMNPVRNAAPTAVRGALGIGVNGVQFRPTTAGFYDPNGRRGHSRDGDRNWSLDINGAPGRLGLDFNNAHVGRGGLYHYHGIADSLTQTSGSSLIGYAGDGFEMHYIGEAAQSGYRLKTGTRPSDPGPGGAYDGTYNEDYEFVGGEGTLDECNGGMLDGRYAYFVTDSYPFVGRCLWGNISADFAGGEHDARGSERRQRGEGRRRGEREGGQGSRRE
ncbi:YHYH protein [Aurantiacibacter marinus]|uniref:YHYH protein n=1 Tax=Aurantiacibacter marinus TaxID=874156 RepID=UPI0007ED6C7B|nr:YHYH protein [Aurantiacibacter marinus]